MSDLKKLQKQLDKAKEAVEARQAEVHAAIATHTDAVVAYARLLEQVEQAEALEAARELRAGGKGK